MVAWGQADPKAAGEWGLRFKQRTQGTLDQRNTALRYAVLGMVAKDPKLADQLIWKHLEEEQWGGTPRTAPMEVARELAKSDPAAALAMAEKITPYEPLRVDALRGILREWARQDPVAARAVLGSRKEVDFQKAFPRDLAEGWASRDPHAAAAYAKTIEDRYTKVMALALVAREMARTDPQGAAELCTIFAALECRRVARAVSAAGHDRRRSRAGLFGQETSARPPLGPNRCLANPGAAGQMPSTAWRRAGRKKTPRPPCEYYTAAEKSGSKAEPAKANRGTGAAYPAIARQLAKSDVPSALELVAASESLVLKSHVIHDVAVELSRHDPVAAADLVERWAGVVDYYGYRRGAASVVGCGLGSQRAESKLRPGRQSSLPTATVPPPCVRLPPRGRRTRRRKPSPGRNRCKIPTTRSTPWLG